MYICNVKMKKETEKLFIHYHDYAEEKVINPLLKTGKNTWKQGHSHLELNLPYPSFIHPSIDIWLFLCLGCGNIALVNMRVIYLFKLALSASFLYIKIMCGNSLTRRMKAGVLFFSRVSIGSVGFDSITKDVITLYNL